MTGCQLAPKMLAPGIRYTCERLLLPLPLVQVLDECEEQELYPPWLTAPNSFTYLPLVGQKKAMNGCAADLGALIRPIN